tara:strand:+ start:11303 stop:11554 length:252 start_codon:yes stop_codon:yes gene_type:complete
MALEFRSQHALPFDPGQVDRTGGPDKNEGTAIDSNRRHELAASKPEQVLPGKGIAEREQQQPEDRSSYSIEAIHSGPLNPWST